MGKGRSSRRSSRREHIKRENELRAAADAAWRTAKATQGAPINLASKYIDEIVTDPELFHRRLVGWGGGRRAALHAEGVNFGDDAEYAERQQAWLAWTMSQPVPKMIAFGMRFRGGGEARFDFADRVTVTTTQADGTKNTILDTPKIEVDGVVSSMPPLRD